MGALIVESGGGAIYTHIPAPKVKVTDTTVSRISGTVRLYIYMILAVYGDIKDEIRLICTVFTGIVILLSIFPSTHVSIHPNCFEHLKID